MDLTADTGRTPNSFIERRDVEGETHGLLLLQQQCQIFDYLCPLLHLLLLFCLNSSPCHSLYLPLPQIFLLSQVCVDYSTWETRAT